MKKKIVLIVLLSLTAILAVICFSLTVGRVSDYLDAAKNPFGFPEVEAEYTSLAVKTICVDCFLALIVVIDVACIFLLFPLRIFSSLSSKFQAKKAAYSETCLQKDEADKQKRIEELQTELDEQKRDEKSP